MILIYDVETTGLLLHPDSPLTAQPRITEFAAVTMSEKTGRITKQYEMLIDPEQAISAEITKITGITDEMVIGKPLFKAALPQIARIMKKHGTVIAHNLPFDKAMIFNETARAGGDANIFWPKNEICTVALNIPEYGYRVRMKDLYQDVIGKPLNQTHRALDDVLALAEIVKKMGIYKL